MPGYRATVAIQSMSTGLYWRLVPRGDAPGHTASDMQSRPSYRLSSLVASGLTPPAEATHFALSCEASEESPLGRAHTASEGAAAAAVSGDGIASGGGGSAHASDDPLLALHTSRRGETVARYAPASAPSLSPVTLLSAEASAHQQGGDQGDSERSGSRSPAHMALVGVHAVAGEVGGRFAPRQLGSRRRRRRTVETAAVDAASAAAVWSWGDSNEDGVGEAPELPRKSRLEVEASLLAAERFSLVVAAAGEVTAGRGAAAGGGARSSRAARAAGAAGQTLASKERLVQLRSTDGCVAMVPPMHLYVHTLAGSSKSVAAMKPCETVRLHILLHPTHQTRTQRSPPPPPPPPSLFCLRHGCPPRLRSAPHHHRLCYRTCARRRGCPRLLQWNVLDGCNMSPSAAGGHRLLGCDSGVSTWWG